MTDHIYELELDNAMGDRAGWVFHPAMKRKIAQLVDNDDRPLFTWDPTSKVPQAALLGFPWMTTTQIPINLGAGTNETEIYFCNWPELIIGEWFGLELAVSTETSDAFAKNQMWIRAIQEVDIGLRHEESFVLGSAFTI